jgi:phosphopantothenoylcysteine decarboxylase
VANVLLGVTGSVAAIRTPALFEALRQARHAVKVVATQASLYFFDPAALDPRDGRRNPASVVLDEDDLHIELRRWADVLVVAPLDANTLAKFAGGLADNCLTCVWRAWDPARPIVLAPAMNTFMWDHPLTARHLRQLAADRGLDALGSVAAYESSGRSRSGWRVATSASGRWPKSGRSSRPSPTFSVRIMPARRSSL